MSKLSPTETEPYNKYGNKKSESVDGKMFDSAWERTCYNNFNYLRLAKELKDLQCQVRYKLEINGVLICTYIADFVVTWNDDRVVVYDAKGVETKEFVIKKKLMKQLLGIDVQLIKQKNRSSYPWLHARKF